MNIIQLIISIIILISSGYILGQLFNKLNLPSLIGMIIAGIIIGPNILNLIDINILNYSKYLRTFALIIILIKAGLTLNYNDLKKIGRPALLLSFIPATIELLTIAYFGPILLNITYIESLLLGSVLAAVSPAVVVPKMVTLIGDKYGTKKAIPQMILAGATIDDIYVITLFSSFLLLNTTNNFDIRTLINVPISIILGIIIGIIIGYILSKIFNKIKINNNIYVLILLIVSSILYLLEDYDLVMFASLLSIMFIGIIINNTNKELSINLTKVFSKLWIIFSIILFVLVGASVNIEYALNAGINVIILIFVALLFRIIGVYICLIKTNLNNKEKLFTSFSYLPKATVQAAIGPIALSIGLSCGNLVLTTSVVAILITAPLGSILMEKTNKLLLTKDI